MAAAIFCLIGVVAMSYWHLAEVVGLYVFDHFIISSGAALAQVRMHLTRAMLHAIPLVICTLTRPHQYSAIALMVLSASIWL